MALPEADASAVLCSAGAGESSWLLAAGESYSPRPKSDMRTWWRGTDGYSCILASYSGRYRVTTAVHVGAKRLPSSCTSSLPRGSRLFGLYPGYACVLSSVLARLAGK